MKSSRHEDVDIDAGFTHSVRPAAGLQPPQTHAARSVFDLGGVPVAPLPPEPAPMPRKRARRMTDDALEVMSPLWGITRDLFAEEMRITPARATKLLSYLKQSGRVASFVDDGKTWFQIVPPPVAGRGLTTAKSVGETVPKQPVDPGLPGPAPLQSSVSEHFVCGLFSNGELLLELGDQRLRLKREQAQALVDYLDRIASALAGA